MIDKPNDYSMLNYDLFFNDRECHSRHSIGLMEWVGIFGISTIDTGFDYHGFRSLAVAPKTNLNALGTICCHKTNPHNNHIG